MKIAQVTPYFYPVEGGVERHVYNISTGLAMRGHEVQVFTYMGDRNGGRLRKYEDVDGIKVKRFRGAFSLGEFARVWPGVFSEIAKGDFDIVHAHVYRHPHSDLSLIASKFARSEAVLTSHSPFPPSAARGYLSSMLVPVYDSTIGPLLLRSFSKIISLTQAEAEKLSALGVDRGKLFVLSHGVDRIHFQKVDFEPFLSKYSLKGSRFVLYLGRLNRVKGIEYLLKAFSKVESHHADASLVIAGPCTDPSEASYKEFLQMEADRLGISDRTIFTGALTEQEKLQAYEACSVFVLPSIYEPYGIVLLEAAAHGKPLVASYSDGPASIINDGETGFLVPPTDPVLLADRISELLSNDGLASKLGNAARRMASERTWERVVDSIERIYVSCK